MPYLCLFPPFCMFLILDNPAPVTPNIYVSRQSQDPARAAFRRKLTAIMIPYGIKVSKGIAMEADLSA